jgi:hypothetical protein
LWFEWLQDEMNLADDGDFQQLDKLHQLACIACPLSSRIWLSHCSLLRGRPAEKKMPTVSSVQRGSPVRLAAKLTATKAALREALVPSKTFEGGVF